ncbi:MAG: hypothetical protein HRT90_11010 [Candidatus Margulisbacteria bacterium]|nr:hypothetical protein [Candidatus Margulisiibacteriota bacterium]
MGLLIQKVKLFSKMPHMLIFCIIFYAAIISTLNWHISTKIYDYDPRPVSLKHTHDFIIHHETPSIIQRTMAYRVLFPSIVEISHQQFPSISLKNWYSLYFLIFLYSALFLFYLFCLKFFSPLISLLSVMLLLISFHVSYNIVYFSDVLALLTFCLILTLLVYNQSKLWIYLSLFILTFNKEITIYLIPFVLYHDYLRKGKLSGSFWLTLILSSACIGSAMVLLRILRGNHMLYWQFWQNITDIHSLYMLILIPLLWGSFIHFKNKPNLLRAYFYLLIPYLISVFLFTNWDQVRVMIPAYTILIPLFVMGIKKYE